MISLSSSYATNFTFYFVFCFNHQQIMNILHFMEKRLFFLKILKIIILTVKIKYFFFQVKKETASHPFFFMFFFFYVFFFVVMLLLFCSSFLATCFFQTFLGFFHNIFFCFFLSMIKIYYNFFLVNSSRIWKFGSKKKNMVSYKSFLAFENSAQRTKKRLFLSNRF